MASDVPENAPPDAQLLIDWGNEHADQVGVSSADEQDLFEVNVTFADASLMVAGTLGRQGPPIWRTAPLIRSDEIETNAAIQFPEQMNAPPIVHDEDENKLTIRTADAELSLSPDASGSDDEDE